MKVSLVTVGHRSSGELIRAVVTFRESAAGAGVAGETVVIDHSEDREEAARLRAIGPDRLLVRPNRGYAAGLNAGIAAATGEVLLLGNPDLIFEPGAVGGLLAALATGWDLVGPRFHLGPFLFPPAEVQTPGREARRWLAARSPRAWRRLLADEVRRALPLWEGAAPVPTAVLSGALIGVRAATAARIGPWDEEFFLYFEETDWVRRARHLGLSVALAAGARVEHAWGHAAAPGEWGARFAASRRRYFTKHWGLLGRAVARLGDGRPPVPVRRWPAGSEEVAAMDPWWLVSPAPLGIPAAGARLGGRPPSGAVEAFAARAPRGPLLIAAVAAGEDGSRQGAGPVIDVWRRPAPGDAE